MSHLGKPRATKPGNSTWRRLMAKTRLDWSRKRVINLAAAVAVTMLIVGSAGPRMFEPNNLPPILWLAAFGNMVQWCAYLATTLRDEIKEMLRPVESKVEEIEADVCEYGDRREAAGVQLGVTIVSQGGKNGRHLYPVSE